MKVKKMSELEANALLLVFGYWFAIIYICAYAVKNQKMR